jgi:hypothetical protein
MKSLPSILFLVVLGTFLSLNGKTCLPCLITLLSHQFVPETHEHEHPDEGRPACPCDQFQGEEKGDGHVHLCTDPQGHSRLVPVTKVLEKSAERPFKDHEIVTPPGFDQPEDQIIGSSSKLRKWFNFRESYSEQRLYLKHAILLI